ncbi:MAG: hypothetical protein RLZZ46_1600 [Bacteroidota bacterium]|jgi:hypothetical protein
MIAIDDVLISEELFKKKFVCELSSCLGACCVEGESGAPLESEEIEILEKVLPAAQKYMTPQGRKEVELRGVWEKDSDGELVTPLIDKKGACAFVAYEGQVAKCAIEKAWLAGESNFRKPVSCHLYPIRVEKLAYFTALNFHSWDICKPALSCGKKLDVPVIKFLKDPLIRRFGEVWYQKALETYEAWLRIKKA